MTRLTPSARPESALPQPPLGRLYDVGGRRLMLHRSGSGGPTVVFLPGAGLVGLDYLNTQSRAAELTTSVLYDRAGTGWSEEVELPRSAAEVTGELRDLLRAAGVPTPYVLVGHSLGGAYARHYTQRFPDEVAGLLLLDPFHEDLLDHTSQGVREKLEKMYRQDLPEATHEQLQQARDWATPFFAKWPAPVRRPLIEHHLATWRTGYYEARNVYDDVADELRHAPGLPDVPLIVLTALGYDATQARLWSEETLRENNSIKATLHKHLAASVPRGELRTLDDAGHGWLHEEQPESVLQAITDLLRRSAV
ncbi:alpha/beta hydrolase [Streptomyces sp. NBC_00400]|uniref:alpha/beta fold hydrolase n=1 Tax=Streptomyces sp. NBC_00400 TaxID=2975737 RepID=UPI002E1D4448